MNFRTAPCLSARLWILASIMLFSIGLASTASSASRVWSVAVSEGSVTASDCEDCGDDIGILIDCQEAGNLAKAQVLWASRDYVDRGKTQPIRLTIGRQKFVFEASAILLGQVGYVPQFNLSLDDPLIEALSAGNVVDVRYAGGRTKIKLKGSRNALSAFVQQCATWQRTLSKDTARVVAENVEDATLIALSEILGMMAKEPATRSKIEQQLANGGVSFDEIMCTGAPLGRHWTHLGGARIAPFDCPLEGSRLTIEADTDFILGDDTALSSENLFEDAQKVVHSNFRWKIH